MTLVITGAAGHLGRRAAELLLDQVDPAGVVLITRSPDALADLAARGAQVRHGDFDDPATLGPAFAGAERVLLVSTGAVGQRVPQHRAAIDAAVAAGAGQIIYTSAPRPEPGNPFRPVDEHRETEELLRAAPVAWTFLRNTLYTETRAGELQQAAATGEVRHNSGDGVTAFVAREDCAAVAAAVLAAGGHEGAAYDVTGPELLGAADRAALYAELLDRPVTAVAIDDEAFVAAAVAAGTPEPYARIGATVGEAIRGGWFDQRSDAVETITGRAPQHPRAVLTTLAG